VTAALVVGLLGVFATAAAAATRTVEVKITDAGCPKRIETKAGKTTFEVENVDSSVVTEFEVLDGKKVIGEKENLTPGLSGKFTLKLEPGKYTTLCPHGDREKGVLIVTGASSTPEKSATAATKVKVTLGEFVVKAKPKSGPPGDVDFVVTNKGSMTHGSWWPAPPTARCRSTPTAFDESSRRTLSASSRTWATTRPPRPRGLARQLRAVHGISTPTPA
jgi:uncharacterized cupredoxin-like copper-binding protein